MTVIMMRPGAMNCMYSYPPTWPTRLPMRLPKITKYSVAVTVGGTMVWPQMRTMRLNSRMMMVENPTHSARARDAAAMILGACMSILRGRDRGRFPLRQWGADEG